ncbi:MAG: hypothetical protein V1906_01575 [Candidatus Woesearchaeota archaeon]
MNTIKRIFNNQADDVVHHKMTRYGRGEYEKFLLEVKNGKNVSVKASWDWSNDLFEIIAENARGNVDLSGKIVASYDFEKDLPCEASGYSKRGKLFTAEFSTTVSSDVLKKIYEKFKNHFILLKISSSDFKLKCGNSLPKPGGTLKPNFCSATLPSSFLEEFVWETKSFKLASVKHIINVKEIVLTPELRADPVRARLEAKRKGVITRILTADEKETKKEMEFVI